MTEEAAGYTVRLGELSRNDAERIGVKAANLSELVRIGLPVPRGFSLTTTAFQAFLDANLLDANSSAEEVERAPLPTDLVESLASAAKNIGDVPFAVRSSGVAEDLSGSSYAGQYETILEVRGTDALVKAVSKCYASAFSQRVKKYRTVHAQCGIPGLSILIQQMIQPDAAGVAFSANPVTGDNEVVVSAVKGLGERLVSGSATPDEWVVRGNQAICRSDPEKAIDEDAVMAVAELARRVERIFGGPQDIEWALADERLFLLQARPITALPQRPEIKVPEKGFWTKDTSHYPSAITPLGASAYLPSFDQSSALMFKEWGYPLDRIEHRVIGWEVYTHILPSGGKEGPPPPYWAVYVASRIAPAFRKGRRTASAAIRSGLPERLIERWYQEWRGQFIQEAKELKGVELASLDDAALIRHFDLTIDMIRRGQDVHFHFVVPYLLALYQLQELCNEYLGYDTVRTMSLLSGLSETSSEPARKLTELADKIKKNQAAQEIIAEAGPDIDSRLDHVAPEIARAFGEYLNEYGHRVMNSDPGSSTLAENPQLLARLLRDRILSNPSESHNPDETRREALQRARSALSGKSHEDRERFEQILKAAERAYPVREDNTFFTDNVPSALMRYAALEIGRRLTARGQLRSAEDAVFLDDSELRTALRTDEKDYSSLVTRRRAEHAWVSAHPGPPTYGENFSPPDPDALPEPMSTLVKAGVWFFGDEARPNVPEVEGILNGIPGSPGRYNGPVRIICNESEFSRLAPGDVLVCPITTPAWSILFGQAGAIITDAGGALSHSAIIAREHGIPAVLGTKDATRILKNGQTVLVDGINGIVQIAPRPDS